MRTNPSSTHVARRTVGSLAVLVAFSILAYGSSDAGKESKPSTGAEPGADAPVDLPPFKILDRVTTVRGKKFVLDILVPSFSPATPLKDREQVMRAINATEGYSYVTLYCSKKARRANNDATYAFAKAHPKAMDCWLGVIEDGKFRSNPVRKKGRK